MAQTRLEARTHRPEKEACRDAPYHGLVAEVKELNNSIRQLNGKVNIIFLFLIHAPHIKIRYGQNQCRTPCIIRVLITIAISFYS